MDSTLEILEKVNNFYNQAFANLITITAILIAFVGVVVPLLISFYQNRKLKLEKRELQNEMAKSFGNLKSEIAGQLNDLMAKEIKKIDSELERIASQAKAQVLHLQGVTASRNGDLPEAVRDFTHSARYYIKASDERGLQIVILNLTDNCLPACGKEILEKNGAEIKKGLDGLIEDLKGFNENLRYSNAINFLERAMREALSRTK